MLGQLLVADHRIGRRETHRFFAKLCESNCFAAAGRFVATELVAHVNAEMMHDHRNARGARAMRPEHGKERCVGVVGVLASLKNRV